MSCQLEVIKNQNEGEAIVYKGYIHLKNKISKKDYSTLFWYYTKYKKCSCTKKITVKKYNNNYFYVNLTTHYNIFNFDEVNQYKYRISLKAEVISILIETLLIINKLIWK